MPGSASSRYTRNLTDKERLYQSFYNRPAQSSLVNFKFILLFSNYEYILLFKNEKVIVTFTTVLSKEN